MYYAKVLYMRTYLLNVFASVDAGAHPLRAHLSNCPKDGSIVKRPVSCAEAPGHAQITVAVTPIQAVTGSGIQRMNCLAQNMRR
jgi:hypothetical protein